MFVLFYRALTTPDMFTAQMLLWISNLLGFLWGFLFMFLSYLHIEDKVCGKSFKQLIQVIPFHCTQSGLLLYKLIDLS